ncbi:hypothetical protein RSOLAG22IIIB_11451 [Rhizoctonia solani]|uniref:C2H2-type domain-containing protein n=1 Tax=Rhizoctonia solani TaxID=456999 RepID=A0A0K6G8D7_9AGAM|nr:hypothetical protein RSOLAG22IIIB_11451 [Rhizoctonia solani]
MISEHTLNSDDLSAPSFYIDGVAYWATIYTDGLLRQGVEGTLEPVPIWRDDEPFSNLDTVFDPFEFTIPSMFSSDPTTFEPEIIPHQYLHHSSGPLSSAAQALNKDYQLNGAKRIVPFPSDTKTFQPAQELYERSKDSLRSLESCIELPIVGTVLGAETRMAKPTIGHPSQISNGDRTSPKAKNEVLNPSNTQPLQQTLQGPNLPWSPHSTTKSPVAATVTHDPLVGVSPSFADAQFDPLSGIQTVARWHQDVAKAQKDAETARSVKKTAKESKRHCSICNKMFRRPSSLEDHLNVHYGNKRKHSLGVRIGINLTHEC